MRIQSLTLRNFKKIAVAKPTISFNPDINVLVGANNAGKTSILRAIQKLFKTENFDPTKDLNYLVKDGSLIVEAQVLLAESEWKSYLKLAKDTIDNPIVDFVVKNESIGEMVLSQKLASQPILFTHTVNYIDRRESNRDFKVDTDIKLKESEHFSSEHLKDFEEVVQISSRIIATSDFYNVYKTPLYLDSRGEIKEKEPFVALNVIENQTDTKQINIRGLLYALKKKEPESFLFFKKRLLEIFTELDDIDIINNEDLGQFEFVINERLKINGESAIVSYDITNVGQGMQSLVIMLSTILLLRPTIVLMDEPEVHMHPSLIKDFIKYIRRIAVDTQFIITTHSAVLIQEVGLDKVFFLKNDIDQKGIIIRKVDNRNKFFETINALGYDVEAYNYTIKPSVFVFTEGPTDKDMLLAFAKKAGLNKQINSFNTAFIAMNGKNNRYKLANLINKLNEEFIESPVLMILDKDETTHSSIEEIRKKFFPKNPKRLYYLNKRQIENYLIDITAIEKVVKEKIKDSDLSKQWLGINKNIKLAQLVEEQKEKILDNFISELFINESLVKTEDLRRIVKTTKFMPLNQFAREFSAEMAKQVSLRTFDLNQKTTTLLQEFELKWESDSQEMCDGRLLLKAIRQWVDTDFRVSFSNDELIDEMEKIPAEIEMLLQQLTKPDELKINRL